MLRGRPSESKDIDTYKPSEYDHPFIKTESKTWSTCHCAFLTKGLCGGG